METDFSYTVSENGLEVTEPLNSHIDNLVLSFTIDGEEYITRLDDAAIRSGEFQEGLYEKLDRVIELLETVSEDSLPEEEPEEPAPMEVYVTVSENSVNENSVSENSVSENALIGTPLSEYSLTDSLLLVIILLLVVTNFFTFLFHRKGD